MASQPFPKPLLVSWLIPSWLHRKVIRVAQLVFRLASIFLAVSGFGPYKPIEAAHKACTETETSKRLTNRQPFVSASRNSCERTTCSRKQALRFRAHGTGSTFANFPVPEGRRCERCGAERGLQTLNCGRGGVPRSPLSYLRLN